MTPSNNSQTLAETKFPVNIDAIFDVHSSLAKTHLEAQFMDLQPQHHLEQLSPLGYTRNRNSGTSRCKHETLQTAGGTARHFFVLNSKHPQAAQIAMSATPRHPYVSASNRTFNSLTASAPDHAQA